ncbi:site-specific integrase [Parabacteroides distasonis]|jgi:integrase|uniref:site-specific integrase n=1 Tax=Parabacteroides distasonis TaxID=823 RepID=UPI00189F2A43|nr:site-specific integrase [Parabacteroides distasonis]MDB9153510.1 site-specific integrase [Parabacteroides distasonis]MDB9158082.1 site-specific integrase [Parabacteroides distasonis]MDB9166896.1 site-specific integrase [Parabacteroides distasonis]MDB9171366.1 site-specific integrase [Parabacteroides distasonis]MDB9192799.1 site-specific integrase [Parabacteroides distasonis]
MATVKIKFRPSSVGGKEGTVYYQVIHARVARQISTSYRLFPTEWDRRRSRIVVAPSDGGRRQYLLLLEGKIMEDTDRLEGIITTLERKREAFTADDVVSAFNGGDCGLSFPVFMREVINGLKRLGKVRTGETYTSTLNSFMRFMEGRDVLPDDMDSDLMVAYEAWLESGGVSMNTVSFYMRNLRAVYNRAVEKGLTVQRFPFRHVYTGVEKTTKRAVPLHVIKRLKSLDLSLEPAKAYARDMLLFSFYTRGMSMVDMAFLKKKDLDNGILSYRRKKTGQQLLIKWEPCMQEIVDRYDIPGSPYLLPVIGRPGADERKQYINASHRINRHLKAIGKELGMSVPLTHYVARHSWASAARSKNIPISVISEGMGHDSETTTRIYLASLDTATIDKANRLILKSLQEG